jgi:hypothetical protein
MLQTLHCLRAKSFPLKLVITSAAFAGSLSIFGTPAYAQNAAIDWADSIAPPFLNDVTPDSIGVLDNPDVFDITFDPGGSNFVSVSNGPVGNFPNGVGQIAPVNPHTTSFLQTTLGTVSGLNVITTYKNTTPLVWNWLNGTTIGVSPGALFTVTKAPSSVEVSIDIPIPDALIINNTGLVGVSGTAGFTANSGITSASYSGNAEFTKPTTSVPGPLPIFGAAVAFGYSRKLRKRINVSIG